VDIVTGRRTRILEKFPGPVSFSPEANYLIFYDHGPRAWFSYRLADGKKFDLTSKLGVNFFREEDGTRQASRQPMVWLAGRRTTPLSLFMTVMTCGI